MAKKPIKLENRKELKMETLTKMQKIDMGTKEIARQIRIQLKQEFPSCVFSVAKKSFSGGSEINVALMSAPFEVFDKSQPFDRR